MNRKTFDWFVDDLCPQTPSGSTQRKPQLHKLANFLHKFWILFWILYQSVLVCGIFLPLGCLGSRDVQTCDRSNHLHTSAELKWNSWSEVSPVCTQLYSGESCDLPESESDTWQRLQPIRAQGGQVRGSCRFKTGSGVLGADWLRYGHLLNSWKIPPPPSLLFVQGGWRRMWSGLIRSHTDDDDDHGWWRGVSTFSVFLQDQADLDLGLDLDLNLDYLRTRDSYSGECLCLCKDQLKLQNLSGPWRFRPEPDPDENWVIWHK